MYNRAKTASTASFTLCLVIIFAITLILNIETSNAYPEYSYVKTLQTITAKNDYAPRQDTKFLPAQYANEIDDTQPPQIVSVTNRTTPPNYDEPVPINANVTDDVQVDTVILNYSNGTTSFNLTMTKGELYNTIIPALPWNTQVLYWIYANDTSGKWNSSETYGYGVADYDPPTISDLDIFHLPGYPECNETVAVYAKITNPENASPINLQKSQLLYWNRSLLYPPHSAKFVLTSLPPLGDWYVAEIPPFPWETQVWYRVYAEDWAENNATSGQKSYETKDSYGPAISNLSHTPNSPRYNETVTVSTNVSEPETASGISQVVLSYFNGINWNNITMTGQGTYTANIPTLSWNTIVRYKVYAHDNAENLATSDTYNYVVTDSYAPIIGNLNWNPIEPKTNTPVVVTASVSEPTKASGISLVILSYSDGFAWTNITMTASNGGYTAQIPGLKSVTFVKFKIQARDNAGNWATSKVQEYTVKASEPSISLPLILTIIALILAASAAIIAMRKLKKRPRKKILHEIS